MDAEAQTEVVTETVFGRLRLKSSLVDGETERGERFWARAHAEFKFKVEALWMKEALECNEEQKPDYGMGQMLSKHEEVVGMKAELMGPIIDQYLKEVAQMMYQKLSRSKATGLMAPVKLFISWNICQHILVLASGYGGELTLEKKGQLLYVTFSKQESLFKVFNPARFSVENFLKHRHFGKGLDEDGKMCQIYKGRAAVVVSEKTPLKFKFSMKDQKLECQFYVQRYTEQDFAIDSNLQVLLNFGV